MSMKGCLTLNCARLGSPQRGERAGRSPQGGVLSTGNVQQHEGFMMQFETWVRIFVGDGSKGKAAENTPEPTDRHDESSLRRQPPKHKQLE